ncbi:GNAT family protein [Cognatiyoonia sp. IB215182]|uniref:GNAT family N-acetyltransferase n=1 Tax=Cognatiyoonia sp. IB215182 TaxID=3097353 RepID=UPI002A12CA07|nr:GNAT family protein [Cognatiyoonia sp. IB215182]MDX8353854.1 GNAT family protein [Cognatiyoonia sp. IB215182]
MADVTLRPPEAEIVRMYGGDPAHPPRADMARSEGWLAWLQDHRFGRVILADGKPVGEVRLHTFRDDEKSASLAIGLFATRHLGGGIGRRAIRLTLAAAFDTYLLNRVDLRVLSFNTRAIRCYKYCGFRHVATESVDILGEPQGEWLMSCDGINWADDR